MPKPYKLNTLLFAVCKVLAANNKEEIQQQCMENIEKLDECGFKRPIIRLTLEGKDDLIRAVALHWVLLKSLGETTQFRDGLSVLNVHESMQKNPKIFMPYFCWIEADVLSSGTYVAGICHTYC